MKKKMIIFAFLTVILLTAVLFTVSAVDTYRYEMNPENGVDIMEGLGAVLTLMVGALVVLYESDLFYTVYYFLFKPKALAESILNVLANACLLLVFFNRYYKNLFSEDVIAPLAVLALYAILRISSLLVPLSRRVGIGEESSF